MHNELNVQSQQKVSLDLNKVLLLIWDFEKFIVIYSFINLKTIHIAEYMSRNLTVICFFKICL